MSNYSKIEIGRQANELGFIRDTFEKTKRLSDILAFFNTDPILSKYLALKGGTAINLTIFSLPRLSVDIDLDFAENLPLSEMMEVREDLRNTIGRYMAINDYTLSPNSKSYHTLDSDIYNYINVGGVKDFIKIEINYSLRSHILPIKPRPIETLGILTPASVLSLDPIEIYASKITALLSRAAARDLYDVSNMVTGSLFNEEQSIILRKCVVFYAAISGEDRPVTLDFSAMDKLTFHDIRRRLIPMLIKRERFDLDSNRERVREYLINILQLTDDEGAFIVAFGTGDYKPELLFTGDELEKIKSHPMALWKMQNYKRE
ncbi:MAG: nucleotidyl transferase AbiEii/AbiGii toxin family protein [Oscillospiraceae bacterium]|nr:nucleotidyl transferase AbiEii/AbiGii toxin family protein [Oscillospiraceae bacterium]